MLYALAKLAEFVAAPGSLLLLTLCAGVILLGSKRRLRLGRQLVGAVALIWLVIAYTPLVPFLVAALEDRYPANPPLPVHLDGIIVLGGAVEQGISAARGQATVNSAGGRMIEAARLARLHPEARVVVSGGNADPLHPEPREAPVMADILSGLGVASARIVIEDKSRNTRENAVASQALIRPGIAEQWVLVTSARHMPRAVALFRHIGWTVIPWPTDFRSGGTATWINADLPSLRLLELFDALHEWGGLVVYRAFGWTDSV